MSMSRFCYILAAIDAQELTRLGLKYILQIQTKWRGTWLIFWSYTYFILLVSQHDVAACVRAEISYF